MKFVISELAQRLKVTASEVIKRLIPLGIMASINEIIDFDTASLVAEDLGAKVEKEVVVTIEERLFVTPRMRQKIYLREALLWWLWDTLTTVKPLCWTPFVRSM